MPLVFSFTRGWLVCLEKLLEAQERYRAGVCACVALRVNGIFSFNILTIICMHHQEQKHMLYGFVHGRMPEQLTVSPVESMFCKSTKIASMLLMVFDESLEIQHSLPGCRTSLKCCECIRLLNLDT